MIVDCVICSGWNVRTRKSQSTGHRARALHTYTHTWTDVVAWEQERELIVAVAGNATRAACAT